MRHRFLALTAAVLLLAACADGSSRESGDGAGTVASAPAATGAPDPDAPSALQLSAPLVGGGTIDLTQYAGTTVALWFWAPT